MTCPQSWQNSVDQFLHTLDTDQDMEIGSSLINPCSHHQLTRVLGLEYFKHVLLVSSMQDKYVPYHSTRIEICKSAMKDSSAYGELFWLNVRIWSCLILAWHWIWMFYWNNFPVWVPMFCLMIEYNVAHGFTFFSQINKGRALPMAISGWSKTLFFAGRSYREMVRNLLAPLQGNPTLLIRYDAFYTLPTNTNSMIGRAAHIAVLDSELFIEKFLLVCACKYFR